MRVMSRLVRPRSRAALFGALSAVALMPAAPAAAASPWQFDQFRWAGGSRLTITVSKPQQLPGVDPAIWPKGYRFICRSEAPLVRFRINYLGVIDTTQLTVRAVYAKPGSFSFTQLGGGHDIPIYGPLRTTPQAETLMPQVEYMVGGYSPAKAPLSPALGLHDLQLLPFSDYKILPSLSLYLPAAALKGKLDVRQGTDAECPTPTELPWAYFRASK